MLLTGVLLSVGCSATFAQSAFQPDSPERMKLKNHLPQYAGEENNLMLSVKERKGESLRLEELPEAVQSAFLEGKYAEYGIVSIQASSVESEKEKDIFTFTLAESGSPTYRLGAGHGLFTPIEKARTDFRGADLLLQFSEDGKLLQVKELAEENDSNAE